jgi:tRNA-Thr(GGU) m(6)t(6)A37 methyltransferase TsaA
VLSFIGAPDTTSFKSKRLSKNSYQNQIHMTNDIVYIGRVHSTLKRIADCPRQEHEGAPEAVIEIFGDYTNGSRNIQCDDALILLTWLDKSDRTVLTTRPRNDPDARLTGGFSTRSPDRPNPIGIHYVRITSILGNNKFLVSGLEVLDLTPIVDIKPDLR